MKTEGCARHEQLGSSTDVRAHNPQVYSNACRNLKKVKDKSAEMKQKREHLANRNAALKQSELFY